jgi:rhomboid protease GluP
VARATPRADCGRISPADLVAFRRALNAATRRAVVTPLIVLACAAHFAAMIATGVPILWPSATELVHWGANDGARLILRHEYWRLIASVFVHGGIVHLVVNVWSLLVIGPLVERIYGQLAFAVLYLAAGIGGAIASAAVPPMRVSVGASGAICGVLGGLLAFLVVHRRAIPPTVLLQLTKNALGVVLFMVVLGAVVTNIDQAAHLGAWPPASLAACPSSVPGR